MPQILSAVVLLIFGCGILAVAWRGYCDGTLPAGPNFFRGTWTPTRHGNPFAFHIFLLLYLCGGMALTLWGLLTLVGMAPPLPLR